MARRNGGYYRRSSGSVPKLWETPVSEEDLAALSVGANKLNERGRDFAMNIVTGARKHGGCVTERMAEFVPNLLDQIDEATNPVKKKKVVRKQVGNLHGLFEMFTNNPLKNPVLKVAVPKSPSLADSNKAEDFASFRLSIGKQGTKYVGDINVLDYSRAKPWLGHITPMGVFEATQSPVVPESEKVLVGETLRRVGDNPMKAAQLYGHIMGKCCFCNHSVGHGDDERSAILGYGPSCAKHWGMPYTAAAVNAAKKAVEELTAKQTPKRKVNVRRRRASA